MRDDDDDDDIGGVVVNTDGVVVVLNDDDDYGVVDDGPVDQEVEVQRNRDCKSLEN